jgi:hypothetical protein
MGNGNKNNMIKDRCRRAKEIDNDKLDLKSSVD